MKIEITEEMREAAAEVILSQHIMGMAKTEAEARYWAEAAERYRSWLGGAVLRTIFPPPRSAPEIVEQMLGKVREAVEREEKETAPEATSCAFGSDDCPCLEPDIYHVFIHMKRMQIECHACGAREDIPLPGKPAVLQAMVERHEGCERKGGRDA